MIGSFGKFLFAVGAAMAMGVAGSAVHPFGMVKAGQGNTPPELPPMDAATAALVGRACANCHSEQVRWPWYSYVAPASWLLERDVAEARAHMNLSRWGRYTRAEQEVLLSAIGAVVRTGEMPPVRYQILHPEARLSPDERNLLYDWTRIQKRRLRN
jgi:hypothetical protein